MPKATLNDEVKQPTEVTRRYQFGLVFVVHFLAREAHAEATVPQINGPNNTFWETNQAQGRASAVNP